MKTIYKNGAVYTGKLPLVEAFAVEDGKFVFAGSSAEADALAAAGDKVVDLGGKFVCSGFNDSHMHLLNYGSSLLKAQLAAHTDLSALRLRGICGDAEEFQRFAVDYEAVAARSRRADRNFG